MIRKTPIAGLAVLLVAAFATSDACAGLMTLDATKSPSEGMTAAVAPMGERPNDRESPDDADLKLLTTQPAQGGAGATGSATSITSSSAPAAMTALCSLPMPPEPSGYCIELKNSDLPSPPTSDLLRPPKRDV
jgi:hypothetical protein